MHLPLAAWVLCVGSDQQGWWSVE